MGAARSPSRRRPCRRPRRRSARRPRGPRPAREPCKCIVPTSAPVRRDSAVRGRELRDAWRPVRRPQMVPTPWPGPKSSSFAPVLVNMMLAGLRLRCVMPWARCVRLQRAGDLQAAIRRTSSSGNGRLVASRAASVCPSRHGITRYNMPSSLADVVHTADVRIVEGGDSARFSFETRTQVGIAGNLTRQHLDRDRAIEARVPGFVDLTHPACSQGGDDLVRARGGCQG